jgi:hypothetical protein
MAQLSSTRKLKADTFPRATNTDVKWRTCFNKFRDFAQVFKVAIGARDG